ncbi:co-chaperone GroES [Kitasatospora sp. NPDC088351]|uniref:co-chaperone GroES n=1 Tax=unclassified Kitasatospora TaxID=2633591 RepID=UPI00343585F6
MPDFRPKDDHLIVKPISAPALPDADTRKGEVVAVGPGRTLAGGRPHPVDVKTGEKIIFSRFSGSEVEVDGVVYVELPEDEILSVAAE